MPVSKIMFFLNFKETFISITPEVPGVWTVESVCAPGRRQRCGLCELIKQGPHRTSRDSPPPPPSCKRTARADNAPSNAALGVRGHAQPRHVRQREAAAGLWPPDCGASGAAAPLPRRAPAEATVTAAALPYKNYGALRRLCRELRGFSPIQS